MAKQAQQSEDKEVKEQYDSEGTAKYYNESRIETIVMMERTWGTYEVMVFCEMTAFKYRMRMGHKIKQGLERELKKVEWYEKMAQYYRSKIDTREEIKSPVDVKSIINS